MDEGAIQPQFSGVVQADVEPEVVELDAKDKALANLATYEDWLAFEDLVKTELIDLKQLKGVSIQGLTNDEIGQQFKVANLAADMIEKFLLRVREANEVVKEHEKAIKRNNS